MIRNCQSGKLPAILEKEEPRTGKRRNLGTFAHRAAAERHEGPSSFSNAVSRGGNGEKPTPAVASSHGQAPPDLRVRRHQSSPSTPMCASISACASGDCPTCSTSSANGGSGRELQPADVVAAQVMPMPIGRAAVVRKPSRADLAMPTKSIKCPNGTCSKKTLFPASSPRHANVPGVRQARGAADLGRRRRAFKGSGSTRRTYKRPAGTTEKADIRRKKLRRLRSPAKRRRRQRKTPAPTSAAHETIRTALGKRRHDWVRPTSRSRSRPRDPTHGDVATNLA